MSLAISTIVDRTAGDTSDAGAIARLKEDIALQKAAFRKDPYPSFEQRAERLQALAGMLIANRTRIQRALTDDFGSHPDAFTDLLEILGPAGRVAAAIEQLPAWMASEERPADPALWGDTRAEMRYEPKGVIGNMAPWNFPIEIACGPLVEILGAGNRAIVKPSDLTPHCAAVLEEMIAATFDRDLVTTAVGGIGLAQHFAHEPWDHLIYTGSPGIGREVMRAAADHLVPVTLELGGKCPAVLTPSGVNKEAIASIIGTKLVKNGQMCITVDHVLVPRERVEDVVDLALAHVREHLAGHAASPDCVGIISDRHLARIEDMLEEARAAGARIVELDPGATTDRPTRRMPLSLIVDPDPSLRLMREEIFGPLLPIVAYDDLDDAVAAIDAVDRPLGLYVFGTDMDECEGIVRTVRSGGATINGCALQGASPLLGFGGSGTSGMGRHHGIEGFREFSNARGVVVRGSTDHLDVLFPPYAELAQGMIQSMFGG